MCRLLCPPCRQMGTAGHSHLHATDSAKLLVFSSSAENGRVVLSGPPALGAGGPEFKSRRPDQFMFIVFHHLGTLVLLLGPSVSFSEAGGRFFCKPFNF